MKEVRDEKGGSKRSAASLEKGVKRRRWAIFALSAVLFMSSQFYRVSNAVIAEELRRDLGIDPEQLGLLSAAFFYAFAAAQIPLGVSLDRVGPRRTLTALCLAGAAGAWLYSAAQGMPAAVAARALLGLGMAANLMGPMKLLTRWFTPREFATLSGAIIGLGALGNLLATSPLVLLVQALGWRGAFMVFSAMSFALSAAVYALVRDAPPEDAGLQIPAGGSRASAEPPLPLVQVARLLFVRRDYWLISLGTFFRYGTFVSIQGLWAGPFLMESVGLSAMQAGNVLVLLNLGMIAGSPIGGLLSDRVLNSRKIVVMTGLAGLATATLLLSRAWAGERVAVLCVLFFMIGVSNAFGSIMYAHIKELMPTAMSGSALTGINVFTMAGAAVFLQGMGSVIARWPGADGGSGYRTAFLLAGLTILGAFALYSASKDAKPASGR